MITIEIFSTQIDNSFDFVVDEHLPIREIAEDVVQMLDPRNAQQNETEGDGYAIYSRKIGAVLNMDNSLYDYGIKTGDRLYIV